MNQAEIAALKKLADAQHLIYINEQIGSKYTSLRKVPKKVLEEFENVTKNLKNVKAYLDRSAIYLDIQELNEKYAHEDEEAYDGLVDMIHDLLGIRPKQVEIERI
ncbi:MAG: hypothetical protein H0T62_11425 [Parachlamydiaceae bacterium]|nr:hypothetical protein [Parachlamydiaceae bacterium]